MSVKAHTQAHSHITSFDIFVESCYQKLVRHIPDYRKLEGQGAVFKDMHNVCMRECVHVLDREGGWSQVKQSINLNQTRRVLLG